MPLILLVIGLGLIIYNYRAIKKEEKMKQGKNELGISFKRVFEDNKEELDDYKIEIGSLRKDIAESLTELQEEILEIKNNVNMLKKNEKLFENKEDIANIYFSDDEYNNEDDNLTEGSDETSKVNSEVDADLQEDFEMNAGVVSEIDFSEQLNSSKTQNIRKLLEDGFTEEKICHELSVSKGEVLLVRGLFKK
ncbi:hypothetical protein [Clostridium sp.]|uniref:hypothetical protein n=1 Tax=Clostridium sp. TaxID=1506 RepID=UPI0028498D12|nr:hypothetical protein [Clostridium sp.]MDR3594023.1 hypothetical protein [Clostridium sp.]